MLLPQGDRAEIAEVAPMKDLTRWSHSRLLGLTVLVSAAIMGLSLVETIAAPFAIPTHTITRSLPPAFSGAESSPGTRRSEPGAFLCGVPMPKATFICERCGDSYVAYTCHRRGRHNYCGDTCSRAARNGMAIPRRQTGRDIPCSQCGTAVYVIPSRERIRQRHFCSRRCMGAWQSANRAGGNSPKWVEREQLACYHCGTPFSRLECMVNSERVFCSSECHAASRIGDVCPEKRRGQVLPCAHCGNERYVPASKMDAYSRHFCGQQCMSAWQSEHWRGPNSHLWKGGAAETHRRWMTTSEYREWRDTCRERDGWRCVLCDATDKLHVHHKVTYADRPDMRADLYNGVTVCSPCHYGLHGKRGRTIAQGMAAEASAVKERLGEGSH